MVGSRLKALRKQRGLTQQEVADKLNISRGTYAHYEINKRQPDYETLQLFASFFNCTTDYLLGRSKTTEIFNTSRSEDIIQQVLNKMHAEDVQQNVELTMIPVLGIIKAGYDLYADQQVIDYKPTATSDVSDGEYFYLIVKGDSMIEEGIKEGMRVLARRQESVEQGKIGVVIVNGDEATLKRVFYQDDGTLILQASNRNFPPRALSVGDARIQGQVTKVEWDV